MGLAMEWNFSIKKNKLKATISFFKIFIYLAVSGLSCGMWDLVS